MKIEIELLKHNIASQLSGSEVSPMFLAGSPGIAKSRTLQSIGEELGMHIMDRSMPTITIECMSGLPNDYKDDRLQHMSTDDTPVIATSWSIAELIADANILAATKPVLLMLEDIHMVAPHMQAYLFKLLLQRSLGKYKLADNVAIVGSMNSSEEAGGQKINSAVRNRMAILDVEFDFDYWFKFGKNLNYYVSSFLRIKPDSISSDESVSEQYSTARSWTALANELDGQSQELIDSSAYRTASMYLSNSAATAFAKHVARVNAIDFTSVVANRELVTLADKDPIEAIIFSYIVNFIHTPDDAIYLFDLLHHNMKEVSFQGFILAELYEKYKGTKRSQGVSFIISKLLGKDLDKSDYETLSAKKFKKLNEYILPDRENYMKMASNYIM